MSNLVLACKVFIKSKSDVLYHLFVAHYILIRSSYSKEIFDLFLLDGFVSSY